MKKHMFRAGYDRATEVHADSDRDALTLAIADAAKALNTGYDMSAFQIGKMAALTEMWGREE